MWEIEQYRWFVKCLTDAEEWESKYHPLLGTVVGRHVFLSIVREVDAQGAIKSRSLKQIFSHPTLTDRAVRLKLRELERAGYIVMDMSNEDGRTRGLRITSKFRECMDVHRQSLCRHMEEKFLMILKNPNLKN